MDRSPASEMPDGAPSVPSVTASGSDHPVPVCVVDAMTDALARALVRTKNAGMNSHRLAARIGAVLWLLLAWVPAAQADEAADAVSAR